MSEAYHKTRRNLRSIEEIVKFFTKELLAQLFYFEFKTTCLAYNFAV